MLRFTTCLIVLFGLCIAAKAQESPADKAIAKAIALLEAERDKIDDAVDRAKIDKVIRDLEESIADAEHESKPAALTFEVNPAVLKKKFSGKAVFNAKTGELTLTYDFGGKGQLGDFEVGSKKVLVARKALQVEAGDELTHVAKFKSVTVTTVLTFKEMNGAGIATSNGSSVTAGGRRRDVVYLSVPLGDTAPMAIPEQARSGSIPVVFSVTPKKATVKWAGEVVAVPTPVLAVRKEEEPHQVVLKAGSGGCAFGNLTIAGVPDPEWFKEFLGE